MKSLAPLTNLILYGNFWISLGAASMVWQSELLLTGSFTWISPLSVLVFSATLFVYGVHRLVGIGKVKIETIEGRFDVIQQHEKHIRIYTVAGGIISSVAFFYLNRSTKIALTVPALLSLAYIFPFFGKGKRLRDFDWIKIFLVAFVWAWVGVILPADAAGCHFFDTKVMLIFLEKMFFIFAITLPFDIRDAQIEKSAQIKTIPLSIGFEKTIRLSGFLLLLSVVCILVLWFLKILPSPVAGGLLCFYALAGAAVYFSKDKKHDYYFSGLLDGLLVLQWLIVWAAVCFANS